MRSFWTLRSGQGFPTLLKDRSLKLEIATVFIHSDFLEGVVCRYKTLANSNFVSHKCNQLHTVTPHSHILNSIAVRLTLNGVDD